MSTTLTTPARAGLDPHEIARSLDDIEEIGNRFAGSPGEARCRDYLLGRFARLGLAEVRLEPFSYLGYEPLEARCRALSPEQRELACRPLQYSASTAAQGEAVYIGGGSADDLQRLDRLGVALAGKVVVTSGRFPFYVTPLLKDRDVAALVVISDASDSLITNHAAMLYRPPLEPPWRGRPLPYPGVTIEAGAGWELVSTIAAAGPVTLRVEHAARYREREAHNVLGEIPGTTDEQVVVGAHYDSQAESPGIWDNGAGLACLLEIARHELEARHPPKRTVVAVGFALEEIGLWGSTAYTAAHAESLPDVVGMVNLDGVSSVYPGSRSIYADESMRDFAVRTARMEGWEPEEVIDARTRPGSDHAPFVEAGVPACLAIESALGVPYYHTVRDDRSLVDPAGLASTARVSARLVERLAREENLDLRSQAAAGRNGSSTTSGG